MQLKGRTEASQSSRGWLDLLGGIPFYAFAIFRVARLFRIVRQLRRMIGGELRRMLTKQLAQSTLLVERRSRRPVLHRTPA